MHKLMHKGLKKKKKSKKGKKEAEEDEFDPEELERYRRERAEAQAKTQSESSDQSSSSAAPSGSDEWQKFQALTAGVDSILKKTQGDLDRIKSTSFFQRKAPVVEEKPEEDTESIKNKTKRWIGFDKEGNPIEQAPEREESADKKGNLTEGGFVEVPEDEDEENSAEEDIFDTTYVDALQNVQLAYIPDSPVEEDLGDDPFDTTNADKVLKTVDKRGKKVVSLGNAVEVLAGRIDYVSTCKISRPRKVTNQDLLLDDAESVDLAVNRETEPILVEKTLLDDDCDIPDIPIDFTSLPPILHKPVTPEINNHAENPTEIRLDTSEFEILGETTIQNIPDLDDDFDLDAPIDESIHLDEADDPFAEKESESVVKSEIIEASFEIATYVNEEDPFDTAFAENLVPGKTELKFIEEELEQLPDAEVSICLTDPCGLDRDYETGLLKSGILSSKPDLLGGSTTDLNQLTDEPICPAEEISYIDPFDTSAIQEPTPGPTELKFLEKELLGDEQTVDDDDFNPREEEIPVVKVEPQFEVNFESIEDEIASTLRGRKPSRPEVLGLAPVKSVAFELPTPSQRPDLLITNDEEKSIPSKPLTPYYSQKSLEDVLPEEEDPQDADPFDTSFVSKATPGKTELKLIESELLKQEPKLTHSISDHDFNPKVCSQAAGRRQSDFSVRPRSLKLDEVSELLIEEESSSSSKSILEDAHTRKFEPQRQESLLDAEVAVDAKPLTPKIESRLSEENEEISYADPFDTSIAGNILPGRAELKALESELNQIPTSALPIRVNPLNFDKLSQAPSQQYDLDFDPRADEANPQDFLCLDGLDVNDKVLTPLHDNKEFLSDDVDPFDTSFATIGPGKTELKLLESELMNK